jgi:hypothetical protein
MLRICAALWLIAGEMKIIGCGLKGGTRAIGGGRPGIGPGHVHRIIQAVEYGLIGYPNIGTAKCQFGDGVTV